MKFLIKLIGSGLGSGYAPVAPGTAGRHDYEGLPVAKSLWEGVRQARRKWEETVLTAKLQFHRNTALSRDVWALVRDGLVDQVGFGYVPTRWAREGDSFRIETADLVEISFVLSPGRVAEYHAATVEHRVSAPALLRAISALEAADAVTDEEYAAAQGGAVRLDDPAPKPDAPDAYEDTMAPERLLGVIRRQQEDLKRLKRALDERGAAALRGYARAALPSILNRALFRHDKERDVYLPHCPEAVARSAFDVAEAMVAEEKKRLDEAREVSRGDS